jgi:hypothetical protein
MKTINQLTQKIEQFKSENQKTFYLSIAVLFIVLCYNVFG